MFGTVVVPANSESNGEGVVITLTPKQQALVSFIEHNPKIASFATAAELAERVNVNAATVVRLAQTLGYSGFPEFQETVRAKRTQCFRLSDFGRAAGLS